MNLLIASNNKHKISEIKAILQSRFDKIVSLNEAEITCDPDETGSTFYENALLKANTVINLTKDYAVLADDTGLCVNALNGLPGVRSARYAGDHDSARNRRKLLDDLKGKTDRSAYFETVVILMFPDGRTVCGKGKVDGRILETEIGGNGFGYDCLFYCNELNKTFGQATDEEKNTVSHRARALADLISKL